jgi:4-hydroxy-tetrahydrodipicolinate synthase
MVLFDGVGVALVTLFDDFGEVDSGATAAHAVRLVELGVRGVVVAGTTGEAAALEPDERVALITAVRAAVDVPVLAGTGAPSARQADRLTRTAVDLGVDGVLALSPPFDDNPLGYYDAVAAAAREVPVLAYHWPLVTAPGIEVRQLPELPIAGVKDSTGDVARLQATLDCFAGVIYTGSQAILSTAAFLGARGAILGVANAEPELAIRAWSGDLEAQREVQRIAVRIKHGLVSGLKQHMASKFATPTAVRMA